MYADFAASGIHTLTGEAFSGDFKMLARHEAPPMSSQDEERSSTACPGFSDVSADHTS